MKAPLCSTFLIMEMGKLLGLGVSRFSSAFSSIPSQPYRARTWELQINLSRVMFCSVIGSVVRPTRDLVVFTPYFSDKALRLIFKNSNKVFGFGVYLASAEQCTRKWLQFSTAPPVCCSNMQNTARFLSRWPPACLPKVTLDEFINGILRCKGNARAIDQLAMHSDIRQVTKRLG